MLTAAAAACAGLGIPVAASAGAAPLDPLDVTSRRTRLLSCAKRDFGPNRTRIDGLTGDRTWCGHGVFAHNLVKISGLLDG